MTDWTAALHQGAAMPSMQQPATIKPQQGGIKMSQPPKKVPAPPALKQPGPAVPFKPAKQPKQKAPVAAAPAGGKKAEVEKKMAAKKCTGCGKPIDPLEEFPGGKCLDCHAGDPAVQRDLDRMTADDLANMWGADKLRKKKSSLAGEDRRWVELESARFVAANRDTLDDSHELAVRAHNHAAVATSTFTRQRSAAVCEAFVATVTKLGAQQYRPAPRTASAPNTNFPDSLMFL